MNYSFLEQNKSTNFIDKKVNINYATTMTQEKYNNWKTDNSVHNSVLKGVYEETPLGQLFFTEENINRIQKKIKLTIYERTKGKYLLTADQSITNLLIYMRAVYIEYGRNLPFEIIKQVKELNNILVDKLVPEMITAIEQDNEYLEQLDKPITPINLPVNVSRAGRKTLPSITNLFFG